MDYLDRLGSLTRAHPISRLGPKLFERVNHLAAKRRMLLVGVSDLDGLVRAYVAGWRMYESPRHYTIDALAEARLQVAVEAIPHMIYCVCEVAADLLWSVDHSFGRGFHDIAKKCRLAGREPYRSFAPFVGNLDWYIRAREIRTEWTHHSTSFVAGAPGSPLTIVVADQRGANAKTLVKGRAQLSVEDVKQVGSEAAVAIDRIAEFILRTRLLPKIDRSERTKIVRGVNAEGRMVIDSATMEELLREHGLA